jgi:hypothetical protein
MRSTCSAQTASAFGRDQSSRSRRRRREDKSGQLGTGDRSRAASRVSRQSPPLSTRPGHSASQPARLGQRGGRRGQVAKPPCVPAIQKTWCGVASVAFSSRRAGQSHRATDPEAHFSCFLDPPIPGYGQQRTQTCPYLTGVSRGKNRQEKLWGNDGGRGTIVVR